jgi:hypothetical protein
MQELNGFYNHSQRNSTSEATRTAEISQYNAMQMTRCKGLHKFITADN